MELTINNLIKIILAVLVIAAVVYGLYYFFSHSVIDFFKNIGSSGSETATSGTKLILGLIA